MDLIGKFFVRFLLVYLFLYIFPFPLNYLPFDIGTSISGFVESFWQWLTTFFSDNFFRHEGQLSFNGRGSGDTTYDYYLLFTRLIVTFFLALFWLVLDRAKENESPLFDSLIVLLRYYLAFMMFTYGFSKVFYLQFPELNLMSLTRTYGDSSPMGLLWKFMGYSESYSIFTGLMEVLGGFLLLFRNTRILGGIITFGIMVNVFVLNMTFDVPVKLFSFHLCIIALIIVLPDLHNIIRFFILNKPTRPMPIRSYFSRKKYRLMGYGIKTILLSYVLFNNIEGKLESQKKYGKKVPKHSLYGIYDVKNFIVNGDTLPPLTTDTLRWQQLIIDKRSSLLIKMDGSRVGMQHEMDTVQGLISLTPYLDNELGYELEFLKKDSLLFLKRVNEDDTLRIKALKVDREDFFLMHRGFNWINEYPMQR